MARQTRGARISAAIKRVEKEMGAHSGSTYARGMSGEGWSGGYVQALRDMQLVLNGVQPHTRGYWNDWEDSES